jgi:histidine ammonia-lyase
LLRPLKPGAAVRSAYDLIRVGVPFAEEDRNFSLDIECVRDFIRGEKFEGEVFKKTGDLEW